MNEVTGSVVEARAAGAYARSEALASSVRATDPVRPRFAIGGAAPKPGRASPLGEAASDPAAPAITVEGEFGASRSGPGLLGALTNFLARVFAQAPETATGQASSRLAGLRAYAQSGVAALSGETAVEVMTPSLPRLSSGRTLDLSV